MIEWALAIGFASVGFAMLCTLYRLFVGPTMLDRVMALDTLYINAIGILVLMGLYLERTYYFEGAVLIAMLGFVSTVSFAKFITRGDIIE